MKFYLIIVQNESAVAIYSYDTMDAALAAYHSELAYRSELRTSTDCAILNEALQVMMRESYTAPAPEPEPTPEPEPNNEETEPNNEETEPSEGE